MNNKILVDDSKNDVSKIEEVCSSSNNKSEWVKPVISAVKINKLTAGYGPFLRDGPVLGIGAS